MQQRRLLTAAFAVLATSAAFAAPFTPGNLVVLQVGPTGATGAPSNAATRVQLVEFTTAGVANGNVIALPFGNVGGTNLVLSGTATSEGQTTLNDGRIAFAGYNATEGTIGGPGVGGAGGTNPSTSISNSSAALVNRMVATVDLNGVTDLSTAWTDAYSPDNNIRGAVYFNGQVWTSGNSGATFGGVRHSLLGATTSTRVNISTGSPLNNVRTVGIFNGQLFAGSASGTYMGVNQIGTGLPTTTGNAVTTLPGMSSTLGGSGAASPYDFAFTTVGGVPTLYIADDRPVANTGTLTVFGGGILRFSLVAGVWTFNYRIGMPNNVGFRSIALAGTDGSGNPVMYAVTGETQTGQPAPVTSNRLVQIVDTGAGTVPTVLATSATGAAFRGVELVPGSAGVAVSGNVTLLGLADPAWRAGRTVSFVLVDGSNVQTPFTATLDASGGYSATLNVAPGTYTLFGQTLNWLRRSATVTVTGSGATGADLTLDNGDANQDNLTDGLDLAGVDASFNLVEGDAGFNTLADFNKDGIVDGLDLAILDANFNNSGDELP